MGRPRPLPNGFAQPKAPRLRQAPLMEGALPVPRAENGSGANGGRVEQPAGRRVAGAGEAAVLLLRVRVESGSFHENVAVFEDVGSELFDEEVWRGPGVRERSVRAFGGGEGG